MRITYLSLKIEKWNFFNPKKTSRCFREWFWNKCNHTQGKGRTWYVAWFWIQRFAGHLSKSLNTLTGRIKYICFMHSSTWTSQLMQFCWFCFFLYSLSLLFWFFPSSNNFRVEFNRKAVKKVIFSWQLQRTRNFWVKTSNIRLWDIKLTLDVKLSAEGKMKIFE